MSLRHRRQLDSAGRGRRADNAEPTSGDLGFSPGQAATSPPESSPATARVRFALHKPRRLYVARHGQTEWNVAGRMQGQSDSVLTERGLEQAGRIGETLRAVLGGSGLSPSDSPPVYTSPLGRALRTAELAADRFGALHGRVRVEPRITEVSFGSFEGLTESDIEDRHPRLSRIRRADKWSFEHPEGESYASAARRVAEFLHHVASHPQVVVITHVGISRILRALYFGLDGRDAAYLAHPQDEILILEGDTVTRLSTRSA